ncbi:hypothetical protein A3C20_01760 [Candidatus Kaiserbacteria bacterium RIFCSPHIGHO2_02_FULL_55_25]|uniref:Bacterial Ig-like domain-containing protein n=1 Tax=Candidatus Kaiserbacteria bacterium RIFCSPHIGHO2_02_FULL_55_25 TaxID=1798498 RepID=A0A1F6E5H9_9BACT|nr:MAG: hypothetical protein A3C20_01760 [Candidatus Kaiserbacteria bacterium RIFCSPHIGHO2_02_FULL_55_25]OGG78245.1 MAG: hypothetical protein A3F56_04235 [Candidatus Kaiserbacteria bacterium RIFCSPHIGHO2_12_FULL_55_13]OGG84155.1 MAG: hypothetical protein A3A42_02070 [Candidatus Kaiserbacteria bacterium RIFCSPLOWO2_01_FULL_55_25]
MASRFRHSLLLLCIMSYALPLVVFASAAAAGFAPGSLWLSKTEAKAGETLKIYTVVYDSSPSAIEGDVVFTVDAKDTGTQHFKLNAGETQIVSADWRAVAGTHTFGASLKNVSGTTGIANTQTNLVNITIADAPPSPIAQYTNVVTNIIASSSPAVQNVFQTVASTTEGLRQAGVEWLNKALFTDQSLAADARKPDPEVLGTSTSNVVSSSTAQKDGLFGTAWRYLLQALLFVFTVKLLFYFALLVVTYVLYKIIRAVFSARRP